MADDLTLPPGLDEGQARAHSDNTGFRTTLDIGGHPLVADEQFNPELLSDDMEEREHLWYGDCE